MPRSRNIKPSFFKNDELAEIDPLGRLLFAGLWTIADYNGRLEYRPKRIKAEILPYDDCDIGKLLSALSKSRFILIYSNGKNDDVRYIEICKFTKHQNPHINEKKKGSNIPGPDDLTSEVADNNGINTSTDSISTCTDELRINPADSRSLIHDSINNQSSNSSESDIFDSFWETYPRKDSKKKSRLAFIRLPKAKQRLAISDSSKRYVGVDAQFIPIATTYINGERWDDPPLTNSRGGSNASHKKSHASIFAEGTKGAFSET